MIRNNKILTSFLFLSILLIFLDAYVVFGVPLSWVGQVLLLVLAITEINSFKDTFRGGVFTTSLILILVPQVYVTFFITNPDYDLIYTSLRYFNIGSFVVVFFFIINSKISNEINNELVLKRLKQFCIFYSAVVVYIFFAQIFDLYEPFRNRSNTNLFGESSQSTFWLSQPHRAMGTFREPSFLITFFYPVVLLVATSFKSRNLLFCLFTGLALGLTRSDYVRIFSIVVLFILIYSTYKDKKINLNLSMLLLSIFFFSTFGVLECNLNPDSVECSDYQNDVENINRSGRLKIKSNTTASIVDIGTERLNVINYFYESLGDLNPGGLNSVNQNFQTYESSDINNEMYLTNRTIPEYLLTRYSTQNFGTGNYSVLKYEINVQNIIVFYTKGFGAIFVALTFIIFIDFITKYKFSLDTVYFLLIVLFFIISPIEELNAYYGLVIGFSYNLLIKNQNNEKV